MFRRYQGWIGLVILSYPYWWYCNWIQSMTLKFYWFLSRCRFTNRLAKWQQVQHHKYSALRKEQMCGRFTFLRHFQQHLTWNVLPPHWTVGQQHYVAYLGPPATKNLPAYAQEKFQVLWYKRERLWYIKEGWKVICYLTIYQLLCFVCFGFLCCLYIPWVFFN